MVFSLLFTWESGSVQRDSDTLITPSSSGGLNMKTSSCSLPIQRADSSQTLEQVQDCSLDLPLRLCSAHYLPPASFMVWQTLLQVFLPQAVWFVTLQNVLFCRGIKRKHPCPSIGHLHSQPCAAAEVTRERKVKKVSLLWKALGFLVGLVSLGKGWLKTNEAY